MKEEIFELLPKPQIIKKEENAEIAEIAEKFFLNNEELRNAIVCIGEGEYFIPNSDLRRIDCPIKRKNGQNYWEAFFILLGFEYSRISKKNGVKLVIR